MMVEEKQDIMPIVPSSTLLWNSDYQLDRAPNTMLPLAGHGEGDDIR
jgi:hypothetical protein